MGWGANPKPRNRSRALPAAISHLIPVRAAEHFAPDELSAIELRRSGDRGLVLAETDRAGASARRMLDRAQLPCYLDFALSDGSSISVEIHYCPAPGFDDSRIELLPELRVRPADLLTGGDYE